MVHRLAGLAPTQFPPPSPTCSSFATEESEDDLPITSYPCWWKAPKRRKESNLTMAEIYVAVNI
jgi:hypothetical protein